MPANGQNRRHLRRPAVLWVLLTASVGARALVALVVALALWATVPAALGQITTVVMSDSMAPGIRAGDVVVVRPSAAERVRFGQVLLVDDPDRPGRTRLHRFIGLRDGRLILRGDANAMPDRTGVSAAAVRGTGVLKIPMIGLPALWWREGRSALTVLAVVALGCLVVVAHGDRLLPGQPERRRRLRRRALVAAAIVPLVAVAQPLAAPISATRAGFSATTANLGSRWQTRAASCTPAAYTPTPDLRYAFENTAAGSSEIDASGSGRPGTLGSGVTRTAGSCPPTAYAALDGTSQGYVVAQSSIAAPSTFSVSIWYRSSTKPGRLVGLSQSNTATPSTDYDAAVYLDSGSFNQLTFKVRTAASGAVGCNFLPRTDDSAWHLAVAVFSPGSVRLFSDPTGDTTNLDNSCSTRSVTGSLEHGGYWRAGADAIATFSSSTPSGFAGDLDEMTVWSSALTFDQAKAVFAAGR